MASNDCPTNEEIVDFVDGTLNEHRFDQVAEHFKRCHDCSSLWSAIESKSSAFDQLVRQAANLPDSAAGDDLHVVANSRTVESPTPETIDDQKTGHPHQISTLTANDLAGRYELLSELGEGGMGNVTRARDSAIGRELAIKVLKKKHHRRTEVVQRFIEEAQIAGQLEHPGIVPIYEMGRCQDDRPFFTMKLVNGQTFDQHLQSARQEPGQRQELLSIFLKVCHAIAFAHNKGVVHRDLKPVNIMIGEFGEVQVMDWGLAKLVSIQVSEDISDEPESSSATGKGLVSTLRDGPEAMVSIDGAVLGTPSYMPPEQAQGNISLVGKSSDVFALGAILLEILTGQPPYSGDSATEILDRAATADLQSAMQRLENAEVDHELARLVRDCLEPNPIDRPPDARHIAEKIEDYLRSVEDRLEHAKIEQAKAETRALNERRSRRMTVALILSIFAAILIGGIFWFSWQREKQQQALDAIGQLQQNVARAEMMLEAAKNDPENNVDFSSGHASLEIAQRIATEPYISTDLKEKTRQLARGYQELESDRELFRELERLRQGPLLYDFERNLFDWPTVRSGYQNLFRDLGILPDQMNAEQAAIHLRSKPQYLQDAIITGIDLWTTRIKDRTVRRYWSQIADRMDTLEARKAVRSAIHDQTGYLNRENLLNHFDPGEHSPNSIYTLASHLRAMNQTDEAIAVLEKATPHFPGDYWLNKTLGSILLEHRPERVDDILRHFAAAAAIRPNNEAAQLDLMQGSLHCRRFADAMAIGEQLIAKNQNSTRAHFGLAIIHHALKQYGRAETHVLKVIKLEPKLAAAYSCYGNILAGMNRFQDSIDQHSRALELEPDTPGNICNLAMAHLAASEADPSMSKLAIAESHILNAIELDREWAHGYFAYGVILNKMAETTKSSQQKLEFYNKALAQLQQALNIRPGWMRAEIQMILALAHLDRQSEAKPIAEKLIKDRHLTCHNLQFLAHYYQLVNELETAERLLDRSASAIGNSVRQKFQVAKQYGAIKAFEKSQALLQSILEAEPNNLEVLELLGKVRIKLGNLDGSREALESLVALEASRTDIWKILATIYSKLQLHRELENACRRIIHAEPESSRRHYDHANALSRQKKFAGAIVSYDRCLELEPNYLMAIINRADTLQKVGRFDESRKQFERALELDKEKGRWRATINRQLKRLDRLEHVSSRIPLFQKGEINLQSDVEILEMARVGQMIGSHGIALRLFQMLIDRPVKSKFAAASQLHYHAARSAAAVSLRQMSSSDNEKFQLALDSIDLAYEMMRSELDLREKESRRASAPTTRRAFALLLRQWQNDPLFNHVRDKELLDRLPASQAGRWRAFWNQVQEKFDANW